LKHPGILPKIDSRAQNFFNQKNPLSGRLKTVVIRSPDLASFPVYPFRHRGAGRNKLHVPHPDFLSLSPSGRIAHVWKRSDDYLALDVFLITAIERNSRKSVKR
jgi:hypothetical protein